MSAYIFFDILEIADQKKMEIYGQQIGLTVERYGGRYLIRGGKVDVLEGDRHPTRLVLIEFPSSEQAHQWYESEDYKELRALRSGAAKLNALLIEGVK